MERVIRFKSLIESMSDSEYEHFITVITADKTRFVSCICDIAIGALSPVFSVQY